MLFTWIMTKKIKLNQDLLIISILTLTTVLVWMSTNTYHDFVAKKTTTVKKELLIPLEPEINQKLIADLENKKYLSEEELTQILSQAKKTTPSASLEAAIPPPATASSSPATETAEEATNTPEL